MWNETLILGKPFELGIYRLLLLFVIAPTEVMNYLVMMASLLINRGFWFCSSSHNFYNAKN